MQSYCIDTSALIAAWQERYPIDNFPGLWDRVDQLIDAGRLLAPMEVLHETGKKSDELHDWLKSRDAMFVELDEEIQVAVATILGRFPRLVGEKKLRTSADPFVIAMAQVRGLQIVTEEKPTGNLNRPNIPDVCSQLDMTTADVLGLIRLEGWIVG